MFFFFLLDYAVLDGDAPWSSFDSFVCSLYYLRTRNGTYILAGFLVILLSTIVLSLIALVPTGSKHRGRLERIARKI